jgi:hypothetical protein
MTGITDLNQSMPAMKVHRPVGSRDSRARLAKPLCAQFSLMTMSPGCTWKSSWNVPPQLSFAKVLALARRDLRVGQMLPVLVIARLRAVVGHEEDADAGPVRCLPKVRPSGTSRSDGPGSSAKRPRPTWSRSLTPVTATIISRSAPLSWARSPRPALAS